MNQPTFDQAELIALVIRAFIEAALIVLALWLIFFVSGLSDQLKKLGRRRFIIFLLVMAIWVSVQMVDRWQYFYPQPVGFYPVARFAMYQIGEESELVDTYRLIASYEDGTRSELNLTRHFRSIGLPSIHTRMQALKDGLLSSHPATQAQAQREVDDFVAGARALLADSGELLPVEVSFYALSYRVSDHVLVDETELRTVSFPDTQ